MHDMSTTTRKTPTASLMVSVNQMLDPLAINETTGAANFPADATGIAWINEARDSDLPAACTECAEHLLDPSWRSAMGGYASDEPVGVVLFGPVKCDDCEERDLDSAREAWNADHPNHD